MVDKKNNETERLEEAVALLSLAADKGAGGKGETCLSGEELAALVDGKCSEQQITAIKEHLGSCETCYERWLTLSSLKMGELRSSRAVPMIGKGITYIGTALALAASVVVYFNVIEPGFQSFEQTTVQPQNIPLQRDAVALEKRKTGMAPASQGSQTTQLAEPREMAQPEEDGFQEEVEHEQADVRDQPAISGEVLDRFQSWQVVVKWGCQKNETERSFWEKVIDDGKGLVTESPAALGQEKKEKLEVIVALLQELQEDGTGRQCRDILTLLDGAAGKN